MSSRIGRMLSVQIFGESHGPAVGVTLDGLPAGLSLDMDALSAFLQRRAARGSAIATPRRESDLPAHREWPQGRRYHRPAADRPVR